jgi:SAM-dependent methyltransferase
VIRNPPVGAIRFGNLRRLTPIDRNLGRRRGTPIDRYYIEDFLRRHISDVKGHVLEFGDNAYTRKFGGNRVTKSDVLDIDERNTKATIISDLTRDNDIAANVFDCIICTQTIQMIYALRTALSNLHRILKPGGVLLVTSHGTSRICRREGIDAWGEYWRLTAQSAKKLFQETFPLENIEVKAYGNVLSAIAFLHGIAQEELTQKELDFCDPDYEVLVTVRARKPAK